MWLGVWCAVTHEDHPDRPRSPFHVVPRLRWGTPSMWRNPEQWDFHQYMDQMRAEEFAPRLQWPEFNRRTTPPGRGGGVGEAPWVVEDVDLATLVPRVAQARARHTRQLLVRPARGRRRGTRRPAWYRPEASPVPLSSRSSSRSSSSRSRSSSSNSSSEAEAETTRPDPSPSPSVPSNAEATLRAATAAAARTVSRTADYAVSLYGNRGARLRAVAERTANAAFIRRQAQRLGVRQQQQQRVGESNRASEEEEARSPSGVGRFSESSSSVLASGGPSANGVAFLRARVQARRLARVRGALASRGDPDDRSSSSSSSPATDAAVRSTQQWLARISLLQLTLASAAASVAVSVWSTVYVGLIQRTADRRSHSP